MKLFYYLRALCLVKAIFLLLIGCNNNIDTRPSTDKTIDSLVTLYKANSTSPNLYILQALEQVENLNDDSLKMIYYTDIAYLLAPSRDSSLFKKANEAALLLAKRFKDSLGIGEVYWHYGIHYMERQQYGESYQNYKEALQYFRKKDPYYTAKMLYNMALIRTHIKDYTGGEVLVYKSITILLPQKKYKQLYLCHNLFGAIYENLHEYEQAFYHYERAMEYLDSWGQKGVYLLDIQNNLGVLYQKMGRYDKAVALFNDALANKDILAKDPALYARIMDNRAYSYFLKGDGEHIGVDFYHALQIRDSIDNKAGIVMSHIHLAEYYLEHQDSLLAVQHARQAFQMGKVLELNRDALNALLLLAKADSRNRETYLSQHIALNENLNQEERRVRDKFTRIAYETETYIEENKRLARDKIIIVGGATAVVLILLLLIANYNVRAKNKALAFETEQQKANEKIYLLTLKQQENLAKGQLQERRRISEDLHDSILARLFGIRLNWAFLDVVGPGSAIAKHREYLQELQQIEKEIRDISHDLRNELYLSQTQYIQNLRKLVKRWETQGNFKVVLEITEEGIWEQINSYLKTNIYKILEEMLHNIVKHASAKKVKLVLKANNSFLSLYIEDDGIGYSKRFAEPGIGIKNIKSRTKKMGGTYMIEGIPYKGTKIYISVPIKY